MDDPGEQGSKRTQFKPGVSGNPSGRPKGSISLVTILERKLREDPDRAAKIIDGLLSMAEGEDKLALSTINTIMDRTVGSVAKKQELTIRSDEKLILFRNDEEDEGEEEDAG